MISGGILTNKSRVLRECGYVGCLSVAEKLPSADHTTSLALFQFCGPTVEHLDAMDFRGLQGRHARFNGCRAVFVGRHLGSCNSRRFGITTQDPKPRLVKVVTACGSRVLNSCGLSSRSS